MSITTPIQPPATRDPMRTLLAGGARPQPPGALTACLAFFHRSLLKLKHVPEQLFDATVLPIVTTLIFTYLFGGSLAASPRDYLQYLLPGILVMSVLMLTMYAGMGMNKDLETGTFDRFRTMHVWRPAPLVGQLLGDMIRYALTTVIIVAVGTALGFRAGGGVAGIAAAAGLVILFAFAISWIWLFLGVTMRSEKSVMGLSMSLLMPLIFLSNIFVQPGNLPGWLRVIVEANPITHATTAARSLAAGTWDAPQVLWTLLWALGIAVVAGAASTWAYNRR